MRLRKNLKRSASYFANSQLRIGLDSLLRNRKVRKEYKELNEKANKWWKYKYKLLAFSILKKYFEVCHAKEEVNNRRAKQLHRTILWERYFEIWFMNARLEQGLKRAIKLNNRNLSKEMFKTWKRNAFHVKNGQHFIINSTYETKCCGCD